MAARGCGTRVKGGLYLESGSVDGGLPLECFIVDYPVALDPKECGLAARGVQLVQLPGSDAWHVLDLIGAAHYPNVADFLEEAHRLGISRRISRREDFSKLTSASRLYLAHPKAIARTAIRPAVMPLDPYVCPTGKHAPDDPHCAGRWWSTLAPDTVEGSARLASWPAETVERFGRPWPKGPNAHVRFMPNVDAPDWEYVGSIYEPGDYVFAPGLVLCVPIERIAVIRNPDDPKEHADALHKASAAGLPIRLEDE